VQRASALASAADILLWMGEPADAPQHDRVIKVHGRADLDSRAEVPSGSLAVSAVTGRGVRELLEQIGQAAQALLPGEGAIPLNRRQAGLIAEAASAIEGVTRGADLVLAAESLRLARSAFDRLTGKAGVEDVLDALFSRFCLGK
jgi:tRNA modification GTPase